MKNIILKFYSLVIVLFLTSCEEDSATFGNVIPPTNLQVTAEIFGKTVAEPFGDGSGKVLFTATADNAISYQFIFGDGTSKNVPSGINEKRYTQNGVNVYTLTIIASGTGGLTTTTTLDIEVLSNFVDDEAVTFLTGGTQKTWYWSASEPGHLGVGQNDSNELQNYFANYYQATPWEKAASPESSCLYENRLIFSKVGNDLKYTLNNGGSTFFNGSYESVVGGSAGYDFCYGYDTTGLKSVILSPSESIVAESQKRGTTLNFSDNGFMGYYLGTSTYDIMSITENRMVVRCVQGNNQALAWYHIFTTIAPVQDPITDFTNLVFSDEFNTDGAPDTSKWNYDLGAGGWGNNEAQTYTNNAANVVVANGNLKITAIKTGSTYTSARLKSENKFEFHYGKIEFRAKLPTGGGTWPALWSLGQNYATNTWPACGEIDIMEHVGNNQDEIHGTLHYPGNSGGNGNTNSIHVNGVSTGFHVYKAIWTATSIRFYVDDVLFHSFANSNSTPFNSDFFLIMNVAMGGNFGGAIDPAFTQSSMEVDYVRVYQ